MKEQRNKGIEAQRHRGTEAQRHRGTEVVMGVGELSASVPLF